MPPEIGHTGLIFGIDALPNTNIMNRTKFFSLVILTLSFVGLLSFITADLKTTVEDINNSIKTGNTTKFISYLADPVDLTLPKTDDSFSKSQAEVILKKFFNENKVKNFTQKQTGKSVDNSVFIIGTYESQNNKTFRSYILIKNFGGKNLIQFIEFEEE